MDLNNREVGGGWVLDDFRFNHDKLLGFSP